MEYRAYEENGINLVLGVTEDRRVKLVHFSCAPFDEDRLCPPRETWRQSEKDKRSDMIDETFQLVQLSISGYNCPYENHGRKYIDTAPGYLLKLKEITDVRNETGRLLTIVQEDTQEAQVRTETKFQFVDDLRIVRCSNIVTNIGTTSQTLEYLASFSYTGLEKDRKRPERIVAKTDRNIASKTVGNTCAGEQTPGPAREGDLWIRMPVNSWQQELSWQEMSFAQAGFDLTQPAIPRKTSHLLEATNTGNWSTKKYLPMGWMENRRAGTSLFWQIEHNGSWHWEIGDDNEHFYLSISGPTEKESHWYKVLAPGETFETVPAAVGVGCGDFDSDMGILTRYRRKIRRPNPDDENLPVIFNDYMNCLFGDPTVERELPMIEEAARSGCEYYVIDAGWYADGPWWDGVGEWKESRLRFPEGLRSLTDHIRSKGMIPGLWLELEVMGIRCPLADQVPDDWFFVRHGKRVYDRSRYQLDFRNPQVRAFAEDIIRRLVEDYGAGYIKMDYNIEPGIGTETGADSPGDGMLEHERAFLKWVDHIYQRWPELVIENCSSGGLRMDYALLSRHSIQSMSDQEDFQEFAAIAANAVTGACPEQAAVWSYPLENGDEEEVIFNMVNTMLLRIHQSGHLVHLTGKRLDLVKEGIQVYKKIRGDIRRGLPFWPLGLAGNRDNWLAAGLRSSDRPFDDEEKNGADNAFAYLAVWKRRGGEDEHTIDLASALHVPHGKEMKVDCIYPAGRDGTGTMIVEDGQMKLNYPGEYMARLYRITVKP